jgi:hypothetical protein
MIRPIHHQTDERIEAHIFVAFVAYCLQITLKQPLRYLAPGLTPPSSSGQYGGDTNGRCTPVQPPSKITAANVSKNGLTSPLCRPWPPHPRKINGLADSCPPVGRSGDVGHPAPSLGSVRAPRCIRLLLRVSDGKFLVRPEVVVCVPTHVTYFPGSALGECSCWSGFPLVPRPGSTSATACQFVATRSKRSTR